MILFWNMTKDYYEENKEKILAQQNEYYKKNQLAILANQKKYKQGISENQRLQKNEQARNRYHEYKDKEKIRKQKYYLENRSQIIERCKQYDSDNREEVNKRKNEYQKKRRKMDPIFLAKCRLRTRIRSYLICHKHNKGSQMSKLIGCEWSDLVFHIESLFTDGMSWDRISEIHIDHIIPLSSANSIQEMEKLCNYKNLQPLWAIENLKKGSKYERSGEG